MNTDKKIAVITAIYGDIDDLKEMPVQSISFDRFCFTDSNIIPKDKSEFNGWKLIRPSYPRYDLHPRIKAKYFRTFSHSVSELKSYDIIIWIDGSIKIINPDFVEFMIKDISENEMCFFKHHTRNCAYEEANICKQYVTKYLSEPLHEQILEYSIEGFPKNNGLIETGCFAKLINSRTNKVMEEWFMENIKYSYQDQVSLPYVLWKNKFIPRIIEKNIHNNEYCIREPRPHQKELI